MDISIRELNLDQLRDALPLVWRVFSFFEGVNYTEEEKKAIVKRIQSGERNVDIAKATGISPGAIANWCRKYSDADENHVKCNPKEDTDMPEKKETDSAETAEQKIKRLEAENERLRAEIAVVKKSIALKVMKARQQKKRK